MTAQSAILPLPSDHARFIVLRLKDLSIEKLKAKLSDLSSTRNRLIACYPQLEIKIAVAFGLELWSKLHSELPPKFKVLTPIDAAFHMPAVPADLLIHIASTRADLCFTLSQTFFEGIQDQIELLDERICFRQIEGRDLTGFIDGTENPQFPDDRAATALLSQDAGIFADGSFVFAQRYVHDLDQWRKLKVDSQERVFGRTKLESIELDDNIKPENAHIARTVIENESGEELEILRHSLPYGHGQGEQGLFFIAYTKDLTIIDRMLERMFGSSGDGIHDHLLHFVHPQDGAYFFAPSEELFSQVVEAGS